MEEDLLLGPEVFLSTWQIQGLPHKKPASGQTECVEIQAKIVTSPWASRYWNYPKVSYTSQNKYVFIVLDKRQDWEFWQRSENDKKKEIELYHMPLKMSTGSLGCACPRALGHLSCFSCHSGDWFWGGPTWPHAGATQEHCTSSPPWVPLSPNPRSSQFPLQHEKPQDSLSSHVRAMQMWAS